VWWMDGVRQYAANMATQMNQSEPTHKQGKKKTKRARKQSPGVRGL